MELKKYKLGDCFRMAENGLVIKQTKAAKGMPITRIETLSNDCFNRDRLGYGDIFDEEKYSHYILDDKDLLMSHINSRTFLGRTVLYRKRNGEKIIHGMNVLRIKTNQDILDPIFASYLFRTSLFKRHIDNIRKDAINQSSFALSDLKNIELYIPTVKEQNKIAYTLQLLDSKIALNRQINDNLEEQLRLITSRYIFSCPNLEKKRIGEIATVKAGGDCPITFSKTRTQKCNIPIFSNGTEDRGLYGFTNKANIEGHSITVAARGTIGYCERRLMPFVPIIRLLAITPKEDGAYIYLHQVIRGMKFKKNGSVQQQLTVPEISFIEIPYPHSSILYEYNKVASPIVEMIERNISENEILTKQRDELLPLLMNGQASVNSD